MSIFRQMIAGDSEFMIMMLHYVPQYSLGLISLCASYNKKSSLTPIFSFLLVLCVTLAS